MCLVSHLSSFGKCLLRSSALLKISSVWFGCICVCVESRISFYIFWLLIRLAISGNRATPCPRSGQKPGRTGMPSGMWPAEELPQCSLEVMVWQQPRVPGCHSNRSSQEEPAMSSQGQLEEQPHVQSSGCREREEASRGTTLLFKVRRGGGGGEVPSSRHMKC